MSWKVNRRLRVVDQDEVRGLWSCRSAPDTSVKERGFTLIEIMVAMAITAVLLTILYQSFGATIRATEIVDQETDIYRMARISLSVMTEELGSTYWSANQPNTFFSGTKDSLRFTSLSANQYGVGVEGPELTAIYYYLEAIPEESSGVLLNFLIHEEEVNLLSLSSESLQRSELGERVEVFELSYFGKGSWVESWDAGDRKRLPQAVEIRLSIKGSDDRIYEFFTRVAIPIASEQA